jgi:hypothetical protein
MSDVIARAVAAGIALGRKEALAKKRGGRRRMRARAGFADGMTG